MYLSSFLGRTVTHVHDENHQTVFKYSDFSMIFLNAIEVTQKLDLFVGHKFLYIQKYPDKVYFHFSGALSFGMKINSGAGSIPHFIMLKNKEKEVLLRMDDGKTFEGI